VLTSCFSSVESRDKHHYTRAQRDPATGYFHAAEAAPHYARISDEDHPLCAAEHADIVFTKDMLSTSHSAGHTTARANVFAREGVYYFEAKLTSMSHELAERHDESLIATELKAGTTKEDTCRGAVRVGFVRREHHHGHPIGTTGYGYGLATFGNGVDEYGNGRFWGQVFKLTPKNPGKLKEGDVIGLMITLPDLRIHQKVAEGTFDQAVDAPGLECGPYVPKKTKTAGKNAAKKGKGKAGPKDGMTEGGTSGTSTSQDQGNTMQYPAVVDIIRDRIPFEHKGKGGQVIYFESPEYTVNRDIESGATGKGKNINPETNTIYDLREDTHPSHALPHLRTLPGSKIEVWVNGEYQGILAKHLLAFLPPCSYIDKTSKTLGISGALDDGTLGYYPAVTTYGGGAAELKFDEPFWFPPTDRPEAQPFGKRYKEQIIDDIISDLIDEVCMEKTEEHFGVATAGTVAPAAAGET
jgi:COMPASS component BRE2